MPYAEREEVSYWQSPNGVPRPDEAPWRPDPGRIRTIKGAPVRGRAVGGV
jgi:hypothetical protein